VLQQFPASWRINGSLVGLVIVQDFWVPTCSNKPWSLKVAKKKTSKKSSQAWCKLPMTIENQPVLFNIHWMLTD